MWTGPERDLNTYLEWEKQHFELYPVSPFAQAGAAKWSELRTVGQRGADTDFLSVDTLTLPYDNPWKALLFAAGVDLAPDGAAFVCTIHGYVWRVTGIDDALRDRLAEVAGRAGHELRLFTGWIAGPTLAT